MKSVKGWVVILAIILAGSISAMAQTQPNLENGFKPYGSYEGSNLDTVAVMNGLVMLHAPIIPDYMQRGKLTSTDLLFATSKAWQVRCSYPSNSGPVCGWSSGGTGVWFERSMGLSVHRTYSISNSGGTVTMEANGYTVTGADQSVHQMYPIPGTEDVNGDATQYESVDTTGFHLALSNPDANSIQTSFAVTDRQGNQYAGAFGPYTQCPHNSPGPYSAGGRQSVVDDAPIGDRYCSQTGFAQQVTDSNGNQVSFRTPLSPTPGTDTLGRTQPLASMTSTDTTGCISSLPISSAWFLPYTGPNGAQQQVKVCYATLQLQTAFNQTGVFDVSSSSNVTVTPIVTVILADGTKWLFSYDSYANVTSISLPTGGTISYLWTTIHVPPCNDQTTVSRAVSQRTLNDGRGNSYTWSYNWGTPANSSFTNTVTDSLGNDTVHVFSALIPNIGPDGNGCGFYETRTQSYQGTGGSRQLLKQVDTHYLSASLNTSVLTGGSADNVVPDSIQTTIYPSSKVNLVTRAYDTGLGANAPIFGNVVTEKEYDWGQNSAGPLLRETDTTYQWQVNSNYLTAHLLDLPASVIVRDGSGNRVAETDYTYDESGPGYLTGASITTQHVSPPNGVRGNLTTVSRWLNTNNSLISSHTKWYDTGEAYQQVDALGNATTHSYDSAYVGAYSTQTCAPQTGNVTHCVSGTYDFGTGLLTSVTNENATTQASGNTPGDTAHTTMFAYDSMSRMTSATSPPDPSNGASAQATLTFSAPNAFPLSVQKQKSVTNSLTDSATAYFDGLGRRYQSQHAVAGGTVTVNTTFDGLDHAVTVTNPFFTTSDPTYGVTSFQYDALDRITQVTKQDGSINAVSFSDNCTTATDEAGKPRKTCSDALGRLIEVDEPQASDPGTNATASVSISGSIGSVVSGSVVTAASGTPIVMAQTNDLYFQGSNQHVYELYNWSGGNWVGGWHNSDITAATGAAVWSGSTLFGYYDSGHSISNVLYESSDQHIRHFWCCQSGNWVADDLTSLANGGVNAAANTRIGMAQTNDLYYTSSFQGVRELYNWSGGSSQGTWNNNDLNGILGAPAVSGSTLFAYFDSSHWITNALYLSSDQHVRHLWCCQPPNYIWVADDLTAIANSGVNGAVNTPMVIAQANDVYYTSSFQGVRELYNWSGGSSQGSWNNNDVTGSTGAPAVAGNTLFAYLDSSHGVTNALYLSSDQHVRHLWCCQLPNYNWVADDLTSLTGGGTAATNTPVFMAQTNDLYYMGSDQHVHEVYNWSGGNSSSTWHNNDLMALTGAPNWSGTTFFGYYDSARSITNIIYAGSDSHLHHLWCCQSGSWVAADLSVAAASTFDSGTVTLTVGGFTATVCFGNSPNPACTGQPVNITPAQVATALALALNVSGSPVTASVSGSAINMIWKTAGPFTPPIASLVTTHDQTGVFSSPSFTSPAASFSGGAGPSLTNSPYVTLYSYDALGNLLRVDQKGTAPSDSTKWRTRTFTYDSLSRLLTANNPESGTISYVYDADGNLLQKTSPAPNQTGSATQTISYCYDPLNRVAAKAYSAQSSCPLTSPVATYAYDVGTNAIGHLSSFTDQAGSGSYTYDPLGRISTEQRTIAGVTKTLSYGYHLNSSVKTITYPSGAVVTYAPDTAGRMTSAVDTVNSINYVTSATYGPSGALTGFISGNSRSFAGVTNSFNFNKRLQPITMLATTPTATVFSLTYDFHVGNGTSGSDNGNVWGITNNKDATRNQTFTYDALNRLASAQNAGTDCSVTVLNGKTKFWGNSYSYDAWGNLLTKAISKCSPENLVLISNAQNRADNGLPVAQNYNYDAAGNMTVDPTDLVTATYDAENRIATATKSNVTTAYTYDGDGNRVEKSNGTSGMLYWYMTPGIVGESDLSGNLKTEYVFFDGERVARRDFPAGNTSYYFSDHLKTASVITDASGTLLDESDYYPWGGELQFSNNLDNHYKFTGKERDTETQLDYFGARYYSNGLGRFITPDWAAKSTAVPYADFADPQSLNLYTYVRNIPTTGYDADGHQYPTIQEDDGKKRLAIKKPSDCPGLATCKPGDASDLAWNQFSRAFAKIVVNSLEDLRVLGNSIVGCKDCPPAEYIDPDDRQEEKLMSRLNILLLFTPEGDEAEATVLYARFSKEGKFMKWGITKKLARRYTSKELAGDVLIPVTRGLRSTMERLERWLTERVPGPLNHEPWAGSKFSERGLRAVEKVLNRIWSKDPM